MSIAVEYTGRQRQLHNLGIGTVIIGAWIGTYCRRDTDGKIL